MRALVIIPRSPTMTICTSPNFFRTTSTMAVNADGVAGVAGEDPDRDRAAAGSVSSPYSICRLPFLPSRE